MRIGDNTTLEPFAEVLDLIAAAAEQIGTTVFVAGAMARDFWLVDQYDIRPERATEDIDFAVECESWNAYNAILKELQNSGFTIPNAKFRHRLQHKSGVLIDLIPYGGLETASRSIEWPPERNPIMNVLGFAEVAHDAIKVDLPSGRTIRVVSLYSLALLKLLAWKDRHRTVPGKDAHDLWMILRNYANAGNNARMFEAIPGLDARDDFDFERAGAELLGVDMAKLLVGSVGQTIGALLRAESDPEGDLILARSMGPRDPESARRLLGEWSKGTTGKS
ncbi:MAG: nucleotidyl transferase AbiEii/AbiGii toxin family protein [Thermoanaerobaculia bacterium]